jgi:hypothetical protein
MVQEEESGRGGKGEVAFEEEGELSQSLGGQRRGEKESQKEVKAKEEGGLHGNKSGL